MSNVITIFIGTREPLMYDLDAFSKDCVRMGRGYYHGDEHATPNDIVIDPAVSYISRAHCIFQRTGDGWCICDVGSMNGLLFHNTKISRQRLNDGDKFYIASNNGERCVISFASTNAVGRQRMSRISLNQRSRYVLGRQPDCDIRIDHPSVSRHHCIITLENGSYYITDNNSMNGVILNGSPLKKKQKLEPMDKIMIADTHMIFNGNYLYFVEKNIGVSVAAKGILKEVKAGKEKKIITNNVSLSINPGEFVAVIGGSGAGKTTLLNCLSGMTDFQSGDVLINGESIRTNNQSIRSLIGYVPQNDIVYNSLTLERMLHYSAKLRMPGDTSEEEIEQKINEVLEMVELKEHRTTMIHKLSGGQKKRASIAVELLASPKLFFLDEPSSGLDPGTEKNLMRMLKNLAVSGKTVIMVTHTVQNIDLCDRVICMGRGGLLCFSGAVQSALQFFRKGSMTDIYEDLNEHSQEVSARFQAVRNDGMAAAPSAHIEMQKTESDIKKSFLQFWVMTKRYAEIIVNNRSRLVFLLLMPVILTILVCIAFQADGNLYNLLGIEIERNSMPFLVGKDTMSILFAFSCAAFWVGIFNSVQEISKEQAIYEREQFTGIRPSAYIFSKFVNLTIMCIFQTTIMMILFGFLTDTTAESSGSTETLRLHMNEGGIVFTDSLWAELYLTTFLTMLSAMCLGLAISAVASNEMALVICPIFLLPQILFSGVVGTLSGITEQISKIVTCRWGCIAYFTSADVNHMLADCSFIEGRWIRREFQDNIGIDKAYSSYETYLFGMNPVDSAWFVLFLLSAICIALSVVFLSAGKNKRR